MRRKRGGGTKREMKMEHLDEQSGSRSAAGEAAVLALVGYLLEKGIPGDFSGAGAAKRYLIGARSSVVLKRRRRNFDQRRMDIVLIPGIASARQTFVF